MDCSRSCAPMVTSSRTRTSCLVLQPMHNLSEELGALSPDAVAEERDRALRQERREILSVRNELLVSMYVAVATLVGGVGWLIRDNLDRIGPVTLLSGIFAAAAIFYAMALRAL